VNRWVALLVAVIGGAILAYVVTVIVGGALLGFLWLFVLGDDLWPAWVELFLGPTIVIAGLALWAVAAWKIWQKLRGRG
jgi:hypothetical protein